MLRYNCFRTRVRHPPPPPYINKSSVYAGLILFVGLALSTFGIVTEVTHMIAAFSELLIALVSFYGSAAAVLNPHFGREFLPVGKPFRIFKK